MNKKNLAANNNSCSNIVDKRLTSTVAPICIPLCEYVQKVLTDYFAHLDGSMPTNLYQLVLEQVEIPLLKKVMEHVKQNQSKAAQVLGISRGTLRKKLEHYHMQSHSKREDSL